MISLGAFYEGLHINTWRELTNITYLQIFSHFFRNNTQSNAGKVVDSKPRVFRDVHREHSLTAALDFRVLETFCQSLQPHAFHHFVHQNLDENTTARRRIVLVDFHAFKDHPRDSVRAEKVAEKTGDVAQAIRLVSMDGGVVITERCLEAIRPDTIELAEPLSNETVESRVGTFL